MNGATPPTDPFHALLGVLLAGVGLAAVLATLRRLWSTTLVGTQLWLGACMLAVAAVELGLAAASVPPAAAGTLRYFAATLTFCPLMALLGAKRPQDRPWHFIVVSLWIVLALPGLHVLLLRPGQDLAAPLALAWFMLALVLIGLLNRMLTPAWLSGLMLACGQVLLLAEYLPLPGWADAGFAATFAPARRTLTGLGCLAGSAVQYWWVHRRNRADAAPLDRLWLDFRDLFGVFWALRVAERMNAAAAMTNSDLVLRWSGFQSTAGVKIPNSMARDASRVPRQGLENLLRRFVSRQWIAERLRESVEPAGAENETN